MIYCFDSNALYTYFGREQLNMEPDTRIDENKFRYFMNTQQYKFIPTTVIIEIAYRYRDDMDTWQKILDFTKRNDMNIVVTGVEHDSSDDGRNMLLYVHDKITFKSKIHFYLTRRIQEEGSNIYIILMATLSTYLECALAIKDQRTCDIAYKAFTIFESENRLLLRKHIEERVAEGYSSGDPKNAVRRVFCDLLQLAYKHIQVILRISDIDQYPDPISEDGLQELYHEVDKEIERDTSTASQIISGKLSNDPFFNNASYRDILKNNLCGKNYSPLQIEFFLYILNRWTMSNKKRDKNDFYDMYILGCLQREESFSAYIKSYFQTSNNVPDTRPVIITFETAILEFLKVYHPLSYQQTTQFFV